MKKIQLIALLCLFASSAYGQVTQAPAFVSSNPVRYCLVKDGSGATLPFVKLMGANGSYKVIPTVESNADYQAYKTWLAAGNVPSSPH